MWRINLKNFPSTQLETLKKFALNAKMVGLRYIYVSGKNKTNLENTYCYNCGALIIERSKSIVNKINLVGDRCPQCGFKIDIIKE